MKMVLSYSLFGYEKQFAGCFSFNSYLRALLLCLRMNRLVYPEFITRLHVDGDTLGGCPVLGELGESGLLELRVQPSAPICKAMLWRLAPAFDEDVELFLCRDLDSLSTYRERRCVQAWLNSSKFCHAITDSVSHTIPLMGGMIGFRSKLVVPPALQKEFSLPTNIFEEYVGCNSWDEMMQKFSTIPPMDFSAKGSDQVWLNRFIYPLVARHGADSIVQHYIKGMPNTFLSSWFSSVPDVAVPIGDDLRESDDCCGHIGAAGWYETATMRFLRKHAADFGDLRKIENSYPNIFYWAREQVI